jgi:hypothetical protein
MASAATGLAPSTPIVQPIHKELQRPRKAIRPERRQPKPDRSAEAPIPFQKD